MELLLDDDSTSLGYWLNWRFFLCAPIVIVSMCVAAFIIWKYEYSDHSEPDSKGNGQESSGLWYADEVWRPCVQEIHPICLMTYRIIAFCLILTALIVDIAVQGQSMFHYYTQWTFTLVAIYFGYGSLLSIHGCFQHHKSRTVYKFNNNEADAEKGPYASLACGETLNGVQEKKAQNYQEKYYVFRTALDCGHAFQVMFQMTAGAVMLTDFVYWCIIFPFLTAKDYKLSFLTVVEHSLNAILILGDTALNGMRFPWFRISYFVLLTGVYVIFEWIVHAYVSMWWPYPILDLSQQYAPLWYLIVALLHLPCYSLFALIVKAKYYMLSRWFPQSLECLR
ncbi:hypothetical protein DCAR_0312711 [Daucus carota subsp. sativus]|uniref:Uncharacterized protein n=1 Tax=Daucus carota subsp. sativus TaxID=79200 RepID=A0AAF0WNX0_DAUCS|nr:PREDICTED: uncharacterized protein LOC108210679 isoform X2 [Daucus carota subsp. sativus]WOG93427.1 hypothetical protein DCAR_0312711 [Daucus carota subsp. sativus]